MKVTCGMERLVSNEQGNWHKILYIKEHFLLMFYGISLVLTIHTVCIKAINP